MAISWRRDFAGGGDDDDGSCVDRIGAPVAPRSLKGDERARRGTEREMAAALTTRVPWSGRSARAEAQYSGELRFELGFDAFATDKIRGGVYGKGHGRARGPRMGGGYSLV